MSPTLTAAQSTLPTPPRPPGGDAGRPVGVPAGPGVGEGVVGVSAPRAAMPRTQQDLAALRARRSELSTQLNSAEERRAEALGDLKEATTSAERAGLEQRVQLLDQRILQIERDLAETGRQLAGAPASLFPTTEKPVFQLSGDGVTYNASGALLLGVVLLLPVLVAFVRLLWRRGTRARPTPVPRADSERLARLEEAVETIAVEVERIGEGQRFVAQLLADERAGPRAVAAPREP
mgnify:FL=1